MAGHRNSNCAVGGTALCLSYLGFFPLTQDSLARTSGQAAGEWTCVHPDTAEHLHTVSPFTISMHQPGLQPKKGHQWNSCPPLLTLQPVGVSMYTQELPCLLCSTRNASGREILPGNTSVKHILLDNRGFQTLAEILFLKEDLQGQLQRRKWTNSQALRR